LFKRGNIIIGITTVVFTVLFSWWIFAVPSYSNADRIPGMDNRPPMKPISDSVDIGQYFDSLAQFDEMAEGSWPRFRGSDFDNINKDLTPLAESWDSTGPPVVWKIALGEGYSGPVVLNGRVYLLDYNEKRKADMLRCFSLKTGTEIWRRWYNVDMKRNHGYSRTIPAVTEKYIVSIGPRSHVMCLDPLTGKLLWKIDLEKEYGIKTGVKGRVTPDFYSGQCPLIDNGIAVIAPGVKALMIGVNCENGKVVWETPNPDSLKMSHGSIIPMTLFGKRMYVYNAVGGVCGVSAEGDDTGRLLWKTLDWSPATTAASPVYLGNNDIAVFGSYGAGGARIKITKTTDGFAASVTEQHKAPDGIASDQQTPILLGDFIWVVMPENAGPLKKQLVCYNRSDLLKPVWSSGKENRYGRGLGPYIISGNTMFLLDDDGTLYYFNIEEGKALLRQKMKIIDGIEAWGPMAIAGKYLIMRDARNLICLDLGK
jgi:outer membrane protein assembly factor BamB